MLRVLIDKVRDYYLRKNQPYLSILYTSMMMAAYYGLFRIGELAESKHAILWNDVNMGKNKGKILMVLQSSKMHRKSEPPQCVKIYAIDEKEIKWATDVDKYCPHRILTKYRKARGKPIDLKEQFFVFRDHSPVKSANFRAVLKKMIKKIGLDPVNYDTHSFHIGHATDLFSMGMSVEDSKKIGRWKSNIVYDYLRA